MSIVLFSLPVFAYSPDITNLSSWRDNYVTANKGELYNPVGDGYCVSFVQAHGFAQYHGNAGTWYQYINTHIPQPGEAVVLAEGYYWHLALVTDVTQNTIQIVEQNFKGLSIVDYRTLQRSDPRILGYIKN